jgi:4-hydroxybenzoate polyprenyltransferase
LAFKLSPIALAILFFYSYTKRFTWTSHLFLGLALGVAPVGAWVAATGRLEIAPFWLTAAVICFLAGFDILYATQDENFDKQAGLHSWVARWGVANSVKASRFFHGAMLGFLAGFGAQCGFPSAYYAGVGLVGAALVYQHQKAYSLQQSGPEIRFTLSPQMMAMNGWISVLYLTVVGATLWFSNGF